MTDSELLANRSHPHPHGYLGAHPSGDRIVIRAFHPGAQEVTAVLDDGSRQPLEQSHPAGVFAAEVTGRKLPLRYRLDVTYTESGTFPIDDPYRFPPTLGELDLHLVGEGRHEDLWAQLGAHVREIDGVTGVSFAVWAPSARSVSVVGDFNSWDGRLHPMRSMGSSGIWELFLPAVEPGARYKYEILAPSGELRLKADPVRNIVKLFLPGNRSTRGLHVHATASVEGRATVR